MNTFNIKPAILEIPEPVKSLDIESIYVDVDDTRSIIDPVKRAKYDEDMKDVKAYTKALVSVANQIDLNGNDELVPLFLYYLDSWISAGALEDGCTFTSIDNVLVPINFSVIQVLPYINENVLKATPYISDYINWALKLCNDMMKGYSELSNSSMSLNNHRYWAALATMTTSMVVTDYDTSLELYKENIDLAVWAREGLQIALDQITEDGVLPLEEARGSLALEYHNYALQPLSLLAADLDGYENPKFIKLLTRVLSDPDLLELPPYKLAWVELARIAVSYFNNDDLKEVDLLIDEVLTKIKEKHNLEYLYYTNLGGVTSPLLRTDLN